MTSNDEEWYWLRRIAEHLEAPATIDGWAVAQSVASFASTIGTLLLAAFAVYIAAKSHAQSTAVVRAENARFERAEREEFAKKYLAYTESLMLRWLSTSRGEKGPSGENFAQIAVHALAVGADKHSGTHLLISQLNRFEHDAGDWPRDSSSYPKFGGGLGTLMRNASGWARDGRDRTIPTDGAWEKKSS